MNDEIRARIDAAVKGHEVVLFMKGTRGAPQCGFSATVVSLLDPLVKNYETINVLAEPAIRDGIKEYSQWPTIPQLYIRGEFVGGCDIVKALHASGELHTLLGVKPAEVATPRITLSPSAARAFHEARKSSDAGDRVLRIEVNERFQCDLSFGDALPGDLIAVSEGWAIHVDRGSAPRLDGTAIDFVEGPGGAGFKVDNPNEPPRVRSLSVEALKAMIDAGEPFELFDVRTPQERAIAQIDRGKYNGRYSGHDAPGRLLDQAGEDHLLGLPRDALLVFHCHHGMRSRAAAEHFLREGWKRVYNLEGGIDAWSQSVDPSVARY